MDPTRMPSQVPITYPKVPTSIQGPISFTHPWDIAMPAAVVGPPILALEARMISSRSNRNSFPPRKQNSMFTSTMIMQNSSRIGALRIRIPMDAGTPMAKKNR